MLTRPQPMDADVGDDGREKARKAVAERTLKYITSFAELPTTSWVSFCNASLIVLPSQIASTFPHSSVVVSGIFQNALQKKNQSTTRQSARWRSASRRGSAYRSFSLASDVMCAVNLFLCLNKA